MTPEAEVRVSPLYEAQHAARYARQEMIKEYEQAYDCRLVVMVDNIASNTTPTMLEEVLFDLVPEDELHLLLWSLGGDGEVAVRVVRSLQERCRKLVVLVPDVAKSAGTLFVLGADEVVMGPSSDLGPVDPQLYIGPWDGSGKWVAAKDIIAAVDDATSAVQAAPETYPIHAAMLADIDALTVRQAKAALNRTSELVKQALSCSEIYTEKEVDDLTETLKKSLIDIPDTHAAIFGAKDAEREGLKSIVHEDTSSERWRLVWRMWVRYYTLGRRVYEARQASQMLEG